MNDINPLFIHAWWRSGSTYIWSKLRGNESSICYYEPFHERIAELSLDTIEASPEVNRSKALRHPIQEKNYFAEYANLIRSNELPFFPEFSYDSFLIAPEERAEKLKSYISKLIEAAFREQRKAVLCFCRSQMRIAWMKNTFGGVHVAQIRNPIDQWNSFNVETYFTNKMLTIALCLRKLHPLAFSHIQSFERFAAQISKRPSLPSEELYEFFLKPRDLLDLFLVIWLASTLQSVSFCDFVLDIDLLSTSEEYRIGISDRLAMIDCPVHFSDCAIPSSEKLPIPANEFDQAIQGAANAIRHHGSSLVIADPNELRKKMTSLSPRSSSFLLLPLGGK